MGGAEPHTLNKGTIFLMSFALLACQFCEKNHLWMKLHYFESFETLLLYEKQDRTLSLSNFTIVVYVLFVQRIVTWVKNVHHFLLSLHTGTIYDFKKIA